MARKKSRKTKPWHRAYAGFNLSQLVNGAIPKRIRVIDRAKPRFKEARTVKAAAAEYRHIQRNLTAIDDAYSKIKKHLSDG